MHLLEQLKSTTSHMLSGAYQEWGANYVRRGQMDKAINACTKALNLDPQMVEAYINRGIARTEKGDYAGAIADFDVALKMSMDNPARRAEIHAERGLAHYYQRNIPDAIVDYNLAIYYAPDKSMTYVYRGLAELSQDNLTAAISDYNTAIHRDPNNVVAYRRRADARVKQGRISEAIKDYWVYLEFGVMQSPKNRAEVAAIVGRLQKQIA